MTSESRPKRSKILILEYRIYWLGSSQYTAIMVSVSFFKIAQNTTRDEFRNVHHKYILSSDNDMFMVIEGQHAVLFSKHPPVQEIYLTKTYIIFAFNRTSQYY